MKFRNSLAALAAGGMLMTACGSEGEDKAQEAPTAGATPTKGAPDLDDAETVVRDYIAKAFVADPAACQHESEAFAIAQNELSNTAECADRIEAIAFLLTDDEPLVDVDTAEIAMTQEDDETAIAKVTYAEAAFDGSYRLVLQDGAWLIDGETPAEGDSEAEDDGPRKVSKAEAKALWQTFCQVKVGVTREQVESWMGEADEESTDDDGLEELSWYVNQDSYTVWFADDIVDSMSASTPRDDTDCSV